MAVKKNAQATQPAEPAKDAAVVETTDSATEQPVTPPVREDEGKPDAAPVEDAPRLQFPPASQDVFADVPDVPGPTALDFFRRAVTDELAAQGIRIRKDGAEEEPTGADLLTVTLRGDAVTVVTVDGQKIQLIGVPQ